MYRTTGEPGGEIGQGRRHQAGPRLFRSPGDMRRDKAIPGLEEGIVGGWRLGREYIESRTGDAARIEGIGEILLYDDRATGCVQEKGRRLYQGQRLPVDKA